MNSFRNYVLFFSKAILVLFFSFSAFAEKIEVDSKKFMVIINHKNNYNSNKDNLLNKVKFLFFGNTKEWPGKIPATFYMKAINDDAFNFFYNNILNEDTKIIEVKLQKKFNDISMKKKIKDSTREIVNVVAKELGAISIVSKEEVRKIPANIRVLYEF